MPPTASTYRPPGHRLSKPRRAGVRRYWGLAVLAALSLVIAAPGASTSNAEARDGDVVLWSADNETGNTSQWDGVWISGDASSRATSSMAHSGNYGNALTIHNADGNGSSPGVRMTYQGRNLAERTDPENLPNGAYYSAWYFIPEHVSVGQQSGWNIFQWKTGYFNGTQRTARALYWIDLDDYGNELYLELFTRVNDSGSWVSGWANNIAVSPTPVPIGQWFHLESYYKWDSNGNGRVTTWLDGAKVWDIGGLKTEFDWPFNVYRREWTVNNYARQTTPTTHTLYIDDAAVATTRLGPGSDPEAPPATGTAMCAGLQATIVGTPGNDVLNGTAGRDIIAGLAGNDVIRGRGGNDVICGGKGRDTIAAGAGKDTARGGPGRDTIYGEDGDDLIVAKPGNDSIFGGLGRDRCRGGAGIDTAAGCESERSIP